MSKKEVNSDTDFVDLHVHTYFSDSTFSPQEVVQTAQENGLRAVAITDHDCIDGISPCIKAAKNKPLEIIPGIELAVEVNNLEIHIIGLFIDYKAAWFIEKLKEIRESRELRMQKMIKKLNDLGVDISGQDVSVLKHTSGSVGRLHLARALLQKGAVSSIKEAFNRYIGENKPGYVKRMIVSPQECIRMIKKLGGIPILAHPGMQATDEFMPELVGYGLMGIEVYHTGHTEQVSRHYRKLAKKYNLVLSGGSDCHGIGKGYPLIGKAKVPYEILDKLKIARQEEFVD